MEMWTDNAKYYFTYIHKCGKHNTQIYNVAGTNQETVSEESNTEPLPAVVTETSQMRVSVTAVC